MINLYQRCDIKKAIVNKKDLKTCQLAFSFCIFQNGKYKRVSPIHYSDVIEDSKIFTFTIYQIAYICSFLQA